MEKDHPLMGLDALKEARPSIEAIFVDDGGVLSDNRLRGPEFLRLIGEVLVPRLGGTAEIWADANVKVFPSLWSDIQRRITRFASHQAYQREYELLWIQRMCEFAEIPIPAEDIAIRVVRETHAFVGKHAQVEVPDATDGIRALHQSGFALFTASGTPSWELKEIFSRMGILDVFRRLCGPDLIDQVKYGEVFYRRVFQDSGYLPNNCLVIESSQSYCQWAIEAGAQAVWVDCEDPHSLPFSAVVDAMV